MEHRDLELKQPQEELLVTTVGRRGDIVEEMLQREAKWLIGFGLLNLFVPGFSSPFGVMLLLLGLAAYRSGTPAMFLVQAVVFMVAAISNLFIGGGAAIVSTVILVASGVALVKQYRDYRHDGAEGAGRSYPWIGLALGLLAPMGLALSFLLIFTLAITTGSEQVPAALAFFMALCLQLGTVVLGIGFSSVLQGYRPIIVSWLALLLGLLNISLQALMFVAANATGI